MTFNSKFELILTQLQATLYNHATFERQHPRILVVTLEYLGDIMVLVDVCLKVLFSMNSRAVWDTYRKALSDRSIRIIQITTHCSVFDRFCFHSVVCLF